MSGTEIVANVNRQWRLQVAARAMVNSLMKTRMLDYLKYILLVANSRNLSDPWVSDGVLYPLVTFKETLSICHSSDLYQNQYPLISTNIHLYPLIL